MASVYGVREPTDFFDVLDPFRRVVHPKRFKDIRVRKIH
jgi:hypothetical protein